MHHNYTIKPNDILDMVKDKGGAWVMWRPVGGIGDAIMMLPGITQFKKENPDDLIVMAVASYIAPVFYDHPAIDAIYEFSGLNEHGVMSEEPSQYINHLDSIGGIIVKYYDPCPAALYENTNVPFVGLSRQEIFANHLGVKFDIDNYKMVLDEENIHKYDIGDRYIVIHSDTNDYRRNYPYFEWLIGEYKKYGKLNDYRIVALVRPEYHRKKKDVIYISNAYLRDVFGVISRASLVIGADSMVVHAGGALERKTLGIFGPIDPSKRLAYKYAYWNPRYRKTIFNSYCPRQYCWYTCCRFRFCLRGLAATQIVKWGDAVLNDRYENETRGLERFVEDVDFPEWFNWRGRT